MLQSKKAISLTVFLIAGLLFLTTPLFAESNMENCGMNSFDKTKLTDEQVNKIENIEEQFEKDIIPLRQKLNLLRTEAYNYTLNENVDIEIIKDFQKQIRDTQGKIEDMRLEMTAEINNLLPEDQRKDFGAYFSKCESNDGMMSGHSMMNGKGMMQADNMKGNGMMKMCMQMMDKMHGEDGMMNKMNGKGGMMGDNMMKNDGTGGMMKDNMMKNDTTKTMNKSEHEQHHK